MTITDHAIRRYKKRMRKRTAARKRVIAEINRDLQRDVQYSKPSYVEGHYILFTSKFRAVCYKNRVITITALSEKTGYEVEEEELSEVA